VEALRPGPGSYFADGTVGGGGHAAALLRASGPGGRLAGCDRDGMAVEAAKARLSEFAGRFEIRQGNYAELAEWVEAGSCDGVLLDLGVSSAQLDLAERGFSFQEDGPLDMRMDQRQELTAARLVNETDADALAEIFWRYGNQEQSRRMARKTHPATRIFQALRMAVNDEIGSLQRGLEAAMKILKPGGRLAVITFHSVEDRVVKEFGRRLSRDYESPGEEDVPELRRPRPALARWVWRRGLKAGEAETRENPRSRSAQCRVLEKLKI